MVYEEKIYNEIVRDFFDTRIITKNDKLIVALSGGIDSMCLLDAFYKLQNEFRYKLCAMHIHHGIRGTEADKDLIFVKKYCKSINVTLYEKKVDAIGYSKKNSISLEEAARKLRYQALLEKANELKDIKNNVFLLIAHHKKDQVETIVHNIIRGTGIKGLIGMSAVNGMILRPLLNIDKDEINEYVKTYNIPFVNDSTNDDINITRNYIRKEIVDKILNVNNRAYDHILELSEKAKETEDYIDSVSKYVYDKILIMKVDYMVKINLKMFNEVADIIKKGVIKCIFNDLINTLKDVGNIHFDDIILLSNKNKGGHLDLPYNITVDKKKNDLIFCKNMRNISMSRRKNNGLQS